jgi:hypothetical protein
MLKLLHVGLVACLYRLLSLLIQFFSPFLTTSPNQLGTADHKSQVTRNSQLRRIFGNCKQDVKKQKGDFPLTF